MGETNISEIFSKYFSVWDKLTYEEQELLIYNTSLTTFKKDQNIHGNDYECVGAILIKSGQVRTYIMSEEGREITLYRLYPGEICMLSASCIFKSITFDLFVDAEMDSEVFIIDPSTFEKISKENMYVENFGLRIITQRFSDVMWTMQQILFMSFDKRLASFLIDEVSKTGEDTVKLTQDQIAKYTGSAREVVSRMLSYFASEGIVDVSRGKIKILDKKLLYDIIK